MDSTVIVLFIAAADLFLSWRLTWPVVRSIRDAELHHGVDVTARSEPPPPAVDDMLGELTSRGFVRIGEAMTDLGRLGRPVSWHMVDDTQTIMAEIVPGRRGALVAFTTMLADEAAALTSYGIGETFATERFVAAVCRTSIDDALALHRRNVDALLRRRSAAPRPVRSLADALEVERIYRRRHFRRYLRPPLVRSLLTVIAMNIAAAGAIAGYYLVSQSTPQGALGAPILLVGVVALVAMFVFYARILGHAER